VFGFISAWFGILAIPMVILIVLNIIDYITGISAAHSRGQNISSKTGIAGIKKKVGQWCLVLIGYLIDIMLTVGISSTGFTSPVSCIVATLVAAWLIFNEIISVLENLGDIGVPVPGFLLSLSKKLKAEIEDKGNALPGNENEPK
jgi:toxin secretion/phage lysis holin